MRKLSEEDAWKSIEARFWQKVLIDPTNSDNCWKWGAGKTGKGYGTLCLRHKLLLAHRVSYMLHFGKIDNSVLVRHKCDNPECVNPNHLVIGTHADNSCDMKSRGRSMLGLKNANSKLGIREQQFIRLMHKARFSKKLIAGVLKLHRSTVERFLLGITYKDKFELIGDF